MSSGKLSKDVILCKGSSDDTETHNEYIKIFQTAGYTCKHLPVLSFQFLNLKNFKDRLLSPNSYSGLILTSRRSIEAINFALEENSLPEEWKNLPTFCIGAATSILAETTLALKTCLGSNTGNSKDLASYIIEKISPGEKPLLYPCSAIARDTIELTLGSHYITLEKIIVYDTLPNENLENRLNEIIDGSFQTFVFFSPSTVQYTLAAINQKPKVLEKIQAVAIGPTTADALKKSEIIVHAISSKPEPEALLKAIQNA